MITEARSACSADPHPSAVCVGSNDANHNVANCGTEQITDGADFVIVLRTPAMSLRPPSPRGLERAAMDAPEHASSKTAKPVYRFGGQLPAALVDLRDKPRWVAWDYVGKGNHWTKLPINPHTGRTASVSDPNTWATFDEAHAGMKQYGLAGVGLVLSEADDIAGIDLDDCISEEGALSPLAAEVVGYAETYVEVSPSGQGIRLFTRGKLEKAVKDAANGIEIYSTGRYLTVTGQQFPGTPDRIATASRTLNRLTAVTEAARAAKKAKNTGNGSTQAHGTDFFRSVNEAALPRLDEWVPAALPLAVNHANGAWRVTSKDLGRDYQEDLSIHPSGVADFGPEKGLTPIDVMIKYGGAPDATTAAMWLCERLGIDPVKLGWQTRVYRQQGNVGGGGRSPATAGARRRHRRSSILLQETALSCSTLQTARSSPILLSTVTARRGR